MADPPLAAFLRSRREPVERALHRSADALAAIVAPSLGAAVRAGVLSGGKRLRPILLVVAYEEVGARPARPLYDLAAAVELVHAYSLVHDDLPCMDDAPLRRGSPAVHTVHGVGTATLAGALLIPWAARQAHAASLALGRTEDRARDIAAHLLEAAGAGGMIGGQALDLLGESRSLDESEMARLHALKTGALLAASLEMGAMAAGAERELVAALGVFGREIGLAFQIADDVLDATATAEVLGKRPSDAELQKSTYVALLGVEGARARARRLLARAVAALDRVGLAAPGLRRLARFVVERRR